MSIADGVPATALLHQGRKKPSLEQFWPDLVSPTRHLPAEVLPACTRRPEDWFPEGTAQLARPAGVQAVAQCQVCPLRRGCARVALDDYRRVCGIWAGVYLAPPSSMSQQPARSTALRTLRSLAA